MHLAVSSMADVRVAGTGFDPIMNPSQILVANIGSTSFKFRLFEMPSERQIAGGGIERIGSQEAPFMLQIGDEPVQKGTGAFPDYAAAISFVEKSLGGFDNLAAVGLKPVGARHVSGTQFMDEEVLRAMEEFNTLLPAHNPPYIAGVRLFNKLYPQLPCIGTFETAFYDEVPMENRRYPVPLEWESKYGIPWCEPPLCHPALRGTCRQRPAPHHLMPSRWQFLNRGRPQRESHRLKLGDDTTKRSPAEQPGR